ncbi:TPA: hypothetical protein ACNUZK_003646 [Citrobacter braakii]|uniref:hypothetical protein n=1 Tax=Citrobacter braakii TaxID=57706 RepID=UPI001903AEE8|nr:hypothetical protein [Citrobacter braakii]MBJ8972100.1 hypothetical protein [Citrobacter braakii]
MLITHCGRTLFAKLLGQSLITDNGEALEGEVQDNVNSQGLMTHLINEIPVN